MHDSVAGIAQDGKTSKRSGSCQNCNVLFFLVIESRDPRFNLANTRGLLEKAGGRDIKELEA